MKKILFASPFVVLAAVAILIVLVNIEGSESESTVHAVESVEQEVTRQDRENYRWNDPTNPTSKFYQVEGIPEIGFKKFAEALKENPTANRDLKKHLLWVVVHINEFKEEIIDFGLYLEFEELQEIAFELTIIKNDFSEEEEDIRLKEYEKKVNEIHEELETIN
ncbi:hypothetical protein Plano_0562 [Planococcus sp. PAMC 21323]|uniref:hypothetical protein n=1 Tax=Planococcus sp. PAMC 21323 TaxID=1526927 RepID=UPI000571DF6B|nr:hypothetical protein [Planococcus sp. PAMC 21323]AIY04527.1 hypothetical protein Plano_0562 [Planococcus sp. PAMC 21323]